MFLRAGYPYVVLLLANSMLQLNTDEEMYHNRDATRAIYDCDYISEKLSN